MFEPLFDIRSTDLLWFGVKISSTKISVLSGGFDPLHEGHVAMVLDARQYGDVVILLNSDDWLTRKKGKPFMSWESRAAVMDALKGVVAVMPVDDHDGTVCTGLFALARDNPDARITFCNGGDRTGENTPEVNVCLTLGIETVWNVGGGKQSSSSDLLAAWRRWTP